MRKRLHETNVLGLCIQITRRSGERERRVAGFHDASRG